MTRLVRLARDPGSPVDLAARASAWARLLMSASLEVQEATATYLSIKHFPPDRHASIRASYPARYRAYAAALEALIDGLVPASNVQYLVALQLAETCLGSFLIGKLDGELSAPLALAPPEDAEQRFDRLRVRLGGGGRTSLTDRVAEVARGADCGLPDGFDPHDERQWARLSLRSARALEGLLRQDLRRYLTALLGEQMGVLPTDRWSNEAESLNRRLSAAAPRTALLEPTPLAEPLFAAGLSAMDYRKARREAAMSIARHPLSWPATVEGSEPLRALERGPVILTQRHDDWDRWLVLDGDQLQPVTRLSRTALLDSLQRCERVPPLVLIPLCSDRPGESQAVYDEVMTALAGKPHAADLCWYLTGSYLFGLEAVVDAGGASLMCVPLQGTDALEPMSFQPVVKDLTLDIAETHTDAWVRASTGVEPSTVWLRVLTSPQLPGLWIRALAPWGTGQVTRAELVLQQHGELQVIPESAWPARRETALRALRAAWSWWERI